MIKKFVFSGVALLAMAGASFAGNIDWQVNGYFQLDGALGSCGTPDSYGACPTGGVVHLTGDVNYDTALNAYGAYSFTTTGGNALLPSTSNWAIDTQNSYPSDYGFILVNDAPGTVGTDDLTGKASISIFFDGFPDLGPTPAYGFTSVPFNNVSGTAIAGPCGDQYCSFDSGVATQSGYAAASGNGTFSYNNPDPSAAPEPATFFLGGTALLAIGLIRSKVLAR